MTRSFTVRDLTTPDDLRACVELQEIVWGPGFSERVPAALLRVAMRVGAVLGGAFDDTGRLLGHVFGLTGLRDGRLIHWSDMLAVHPDARDRGIGLALKRYQRDRLLAAGVTVAEWTFDPLEARNAHVNFARCGGIAREYVRDFYASSDSPLHTGLATDRLIITWQLDSPRVDNRLAGTANLPTREQHARAALLNHVHDERGLPASEEPRLDVEDAELQLAIPADFQSIRAADPTLARHWRQITRTAFEHYLHRGYLVTEYFRGTPCGTYLLVKSTGRTS